MANPIADGLGSVANKVKSVIKGGANAAHPLDSKIADVEAMIRGGRLSPEGMDKATLYLQQLKSQRDGGTLPTNPQAPQMPTTNMNAAPSNTGISPQAMQDASNIQSTQQPRVGPQPYQSTQEQFSALKQAQASEESELAGIAEAERTLNKALQEAILLHKDADAANLRQALVVLAGKKGELQGQTTRALSDERGATARFEQEQAAKMQQFDANKQIQSENAMLTGRARQEVKMSTAATTQRDEDMLARNFEAAKNAYIKNGMHPAEAEKKAFDDLASYKNLDSHDKAVVNSTIDAIGKGDEQLGNKMLEVSRMKYINDAAHKGVSEEEALTKYNELYSLGWKIADMREPATGNEKLLRSGFNSGLKTTSIEKDTSKRFGYTSPLKAKMYGKDTDSIYARLEDDYNAPNKKIAQLKKKLADSIDNPETFETRLTPKSVVNTDIKVYKYLNNKRYDTSGNMQSYLDRIESDKDIETFVKLFVDKKHVTDNPHAIRGFKNELVDYLSKQDFISDEKKQTLLRRAAAEIDYLGVSRANNEKTFKKPLDIKKEADIEAKEELSNTDNYPFMVNQKPEIKQKFINDLSSILYNQKQAERYTNYLNSKYSKVVGMQGEQANSINDSFTADIKKSIKNFEREAEATKKSFMLKVKTYSEGNIISKDSITGKKKRVVSTTINKAENLKNELIHAFNTLQKAERESSANLPQYKADYEHALSKLKDKGIKEAEIEKILNIGNKPVDDTLRQISQKSPVTRREFEKLVHSNIKKQEGAEVDNAVARPDVADEDVLNKALKFKESNKQRSQEEIEKALKETMARKDKENKQKQFDALKEKHSKLYKMLQNQGVAEDAIFEMLKTIKN